jgi:hypothetical protein
MQTKQQGPRPETAPVMGGSFERRR